MSAEAVLCHARELGITLTLVGDKVRYSPRAVPAGFVEELRQHKQRVIEYLKSRSNHCHACVCDPWCARDDAACHVCHGPLCVDCGDCLNASAVWRKAQGLIVG